MEHKRPRKGGRDHCFVGEVDKGVVGEDGSRLLSSFGEEHIHRIKGGNAVFARGSFGELSIAIRSRHQTQSSSNVDASNRYPLLYSFVAVKTIHNAIANGSGSAARFGGFGRSLSSSQQQLSNEVFNELLALRLLQTHPNIVPLVAVFPGGNHGSLSLAFRYCPMDLREVLEVRRRTFQQPLAFRFLRSIIRDVFTAISHCHHTGILHRDVKPGNLLVSSKGIIQLCDFGLAKPFLSLEEEEIGNFTTNEENKQGTTQGTIINDKGLCTLYYRPPEVLLGGPSECPPVDVWSAGVVLAELITGRPLWPGRNTIDQISIVFELLGTPDEKTWPSVQKLPDYGKLNFGTKSPKGWEHVLPRATETPMLVDLVSKILTLNPKQRLTAQEVLDHNWLEENSADDASLVVPIASYREVRDELIMPRNLQIPPLLLPGDRALVEKLGLGISESRRSILSPKIQDGRWQGPTLTPLNFCD